MTWLTQTLDYLDSLSARNTAGEFENYALAVSWTTGEDPESLTAGLQDATLALRAHVAPTFLWNPCGSFIGGGAIEQAKWEAMCDGDWLDDFNVLSLVVLYHLETLFLGTSEAGLIETFLALAAQPDDFAVLVDNVPPNSENIIIPETIKTGLEGVAGLLVLLLLVQVAGVLK